MKFALPIAALLLASCTAFAAPTPPPVPSDAAHTLHYRQPAQKWASEALPIGNGRMGAMLFGGVEQERIQFNENSLWGGDNNWAGGYDCGDHGFGCYRNFGDIKIQWGGLQGPEATSPSGHAAGNGQPLDAALDGKADTKWCVEGPGNTVSWQVLLPAAQMVKSYTLTSAADVPARDPKAWVLEGSADDATWTELDRRNPGQPFAARGQTQSFDIAHPAACKYYRLSFDTKGYSHFQVADIALAGVVFAPPVEKSVPADYRRALDIRTGIATASFTQNGTHFTREAFASHPDQVMAFRYGADKAGALSGRIQLKSGQAAKTVATEEGLSFAGQMPNTLKHACALRVLHTGGSVRVAGDALVFENCDSLTLLVDARTDYKPDYAAGWRNGKDPLAEARKELAAAQLKPYDALRAAHVRDCASLLGRATLDVGATDPAVAALPTDVRLHRYVDDGKPDPDLEEMMFQMGRYLLASSSRPGGLPANLQGLWNDSNSPMWASDYHSNINLQMNYWPAENTNLSECHESLIDYIAAQAPAYRVASRKSFGDKTRGWTAQTSQSIFGGGGWEWNIPASAWYATHAFEHYAFTQDQAYLRQTGYPMLKECCEFWEDRLKKMPDGTLMAPNGWSPEHGPRADGVMMDQEIIWELFDDYLQAAKALGVDADYRKKVADMQAHLAPNKIGKWGQLQEWQADMDSPGDRHRHTSHLFALFPGRQISVARTPELAKAARVSLLARSGDTDGPGRKPYTFRSMPGDSIYGWVWAWRAALWARLGDAERARVMVQGKMGNSYANLMGSNVPYAWHQELIQLDNSFGITAAMAEMLLQSHAGEISLLPALPKAWAAKGSFTGLCARGDYTVDCAWVDGKVTQYRIRAGKNAKDGKVKVRVNGEVKEVTPQ